MTFRRLLLVVGVALLALAIPTASASATTKGAKRITYKFGPIDIKPGQNTISLAPNDGFPRVPGYITHFKPDLIRVSDGCDPARRRPAPAPRGVARERLPAVRGRRGEDDRRHASGYGWRPSRPTGGS